ncbi:MAG TPA: hypothetical protein VH561_15550, partial [Micromonosporaceae bacterium]
MLSLVFHALRARRAQSLVMFVLAMLAALGASAAPWFLAWGGDAVARANLVSAPFSDRVVIGNGSIQYQAAGPSPVQFTREQVAQHLAVPGVQTQVGARVLASVSPEQPAGSAPIPPADVVSAALYLVYHDDVCEHVVFVAGACPNGQGEVVIARAVADQLGVGVGDPVVFKAFRLTHDAALRVAGIYELPDPYEAYWSGTQLLPEVVGDRSTADPAFVSEQTLLGLPLDGMDVEAHILLPDSAFTDESAGLGRTLRQAAAELHQQGIELTSSATNLLNQIADDRWFVMIGVQVAAVQLVLLCWVGLFLAVRHTSQERRLDIGLFKLRGAR